MLADAEMIEPVEHVVDKGSILLEITLDRAQRSALDSVQLAALLAWRRTETYVRGLSDEVLCDVVVAHPLCPIRRCHVVVAPNCDVGASLYKFTNGGHLGAVSSVDKRGVSLLVSDVDIGLALD